MKKQEISQVNLLLFLLICDQVIDRVMAFNIYKIADLRSRMSDVKERYGVIPKRWTKKGKRYLEYQLKTNSNGNSIK